MRMMRDQGGPPPFEPTGGPRPRRPGRGGLPMGGPSPILAAPLPPPHMHDPRKIRRLVLTCLSPFPCVPYSVLTMRHKQFISISWNIVNKISMLIVKKLNTDYFSGVLLDILCRNLPWYANISLEKRLQWPGLYWKPKGCLLGIPALHVYHRKPKLITPWSSRYRPEPSKNWGLKQPDYSTRDITTPKNRIPDYCSEAGTAFDHDMQISQVHYEIWMIRLQIWAH